MSEIIDLDPIKFFKADGRHLQILFLGCFIAYGNTFLGWEQDYLKYASIFCACIITQFIGCYFFNKSYSSVKSALITSLGLILLLKGNHYYDYMIAGFIAIASKFLLKINDKHIFNPANIGIVASMLLTGNTWISPGQWGNAAILIFLVGSLGLTVVMKVGKLDTTLGFMIVFLSLEFGRNIIYKDWPIDFFIHQISNGSLLLFSFFMITDPVSTPSHKYARVLWAGCIGVIAFVLSNFYFVTTAPLWALFFFSFTTPVWDYLFKEKKYEWQ
jgi:Na+-transporting NADH:ubiquinone oxidoreductase subunit NqrB